MSAVASEARRAAVSDRELRDCLAPGLAARLGPQATITSLRREPFDGATSYAAEVVRVGLSARGEWKLFLKDLSTSRLPKDAIRDRREREFRVYRDLLPHTAAAAECYGALADVSRDRLCLLLEFVDGVQLDGCGLESWLAAARWPARLQAAMARHAGTLEQSAFLVQHDAAFFSAKAELAERAVGQVSRELARRLAGALDGYDRVVAVLARQPRTLAHGSYRPENILVARTPSALRICPVDWELAAYGATLLDIAFLVDAADRSWRELLCDAYADEAVRSGVPVPPRDVLRHTVTCFRFHKTLKALSECVSWAFPERKVVRLVGMAEAARDALKGLDA